MSKVNLKDDIWIEGFNEKINLNLSCDVYFEDTHDVIYKGKTSDIPENVANECVESYCIYKDEYTTFKKYSDITWCVYPYETAKESIQSACDNPYCIIYKTK